MTEHRQPPSNAPLYAVLLFGAALTFGCLASWLGSAVIWLVIVGAALALLAGFHYWLWGRDMEARDDETNP